MNLIPKQYWKKIPYWVKDHGRTICKAPDPFCSKCPLNKMCPEQGITKKF